MERGHERRALERRRRRQARENNRDGRRVVRQHLIRSYYRERAGSCYLNTDLPHCYFQLRAGQVDNGVNVENGYYLGTTDLNPVGVDNEMVSIGIAAILAGMPVRLSMGYTSSEEDEKAFGDEKESEAVESLVELQRSESSGSASTTATQSTALYEDQDVQDISIIPSPEPVAPADGDIQPWQDEPDWVPPSQEVVGPEYEPTPPDFIEEGREGTSEDTETSEDEVNLENEYLTPLTQKATQVL
jgi:hypothetical protein